MKSPSMYYLLKCRYLFLLMGFFATYCGFIYNDMMSLPLNLFGSCWFSTRGGKQIQSLDDCVYPFGMDPRWYVSFKQLTFENSFKMKMAVLLGVAQMMLGIFMKGANCLHFRMYVDFCFEFIPQVIFLTCLFGYMDLLIVLKWLTDYTGRENVAPSIIVQMINMFLNGGIIDGSPLIGTAEY
jgi:V-type H+-transporting ATPase subunit a